jgi:hypothetical protein
VKKREGRYFADFTHHFPVCTLLPAQRQGLAPGAGVSVGATCLIPTGSGLRPSFAQPVGEVVPAVLTSELIVDATTRLTGTVWDAHFTLLVPPLLLLENRDSLLAI